MKKFIIILLVIGSFAACKDKTTAVTKSTTTKEVTKTNKNTTPTKKVAHVGTPYTIDNSKSTITWKGSKPAGEHQGTIRIKSGTLYQKDGKLTGGDIVIDMNTINCTDQTGDDKADLENHLKGNISGKEDHFFNVSSYPTASFTLTKVVELKNSETAYMGLGSMTIKGKSRPIGIKFDIKDDGNALHIISKGFQFDRTKFGVNYMSKSVFPNLKDMFVNDKIGLDLDIIASK